MVPAVPAIRNVGFKLAKTILRMNWLFVVKKRRPPESQPMIVDMWLANSKLARNWHVGDYSRVAEGPPISMDKNLGSRQHEVNALSESFRRSFAVSGRLAGEPLITIRQEEVVDRKQLSV
jgi:hypothetical protein